MTLCKSESGTMEFDHKLISYIRHEKHDATKSILQKYQYLYKLVDSSGQTLLHVSAKYGNSEISRYLIQCGCKVNAQDELGMTPLMLAITEAQEDAIVVVLLQANADIHLTDIQKSSSLRKVIEMSQTWLSNLSAGSLQNTKRWHSPSLTIKYCGILRAIFSQVENEFLVDKELMAERLREVHCPLALTIFINNAAVTEYLLGVGFFLDERVRSLSALHIAVALSDLENAKLLLRCGADVDDMDNQQRTPLFFYDNNDDDFDQKQLMILKTLVNHGASLTVPRSDGVTLMEYFFVNGHRNALMTLVRTKTDELKKSTLDGRTPLHFLARNQNGMDEVMEALLTIKNIDIDARDFEGKTALIEAANNFKVLSVRSLINAGAKVSLIDIFNRSVLFDALRMCRNLEVCAHIVHLLVHRTNCSSNIPFASKTGFDDQRYKKYFYITKLMLKHLTLDEASGESVNEDTLTKIRSSSLLSDYYDSCKLDLQDMKTTVVYGTVTLYKLISESEEKIVLYARNEEFIKAFEGFMKDKSCDKYYYFHFLQKRIYSALEQATLIRKACCVICKITQLYSDRDLDPDVFYEIATYLSNQDLHNLLNV